MSTVTIDSGTPLVCIPGSLRVEIDHDVRGGDNVPVAIAGEGLNGECDVLVDSVAPTYATLIALRSGVGAGAKDVDWVDLLAGSGSAKDCLVDVETIGDGVQSVKIKWKGTIAEA